MSKNNSDRTEICQEEQADEMAMPWQCNEQYVNLEDASLRKIMNEMIDTMKNSMEKLVTTKMNEILKKNMVKQGQQLQKKSLYAEKVKEKWEEVIIVQPKKNQTSETTKKICKVKLNSIEMNVGIECKKDKKWLDRHNVQK